MTIFTSTRGLLSLIVVGWISVAEPLVAQSNTFPSIGSVGIGTTSPLTLLDVAGMLRLDTPTTQANYFTTMTARYDASHPFSLSVENNTGGTASEVMGVYSPAGGGYLNLALGLNGNVGIGTTSPAYILDVANGALRVANENLNVDNVQLVVGNSNNPTNTRNNWVQINASVAGADTTWAFGALPNSPVARMAFTYLGSRSTAPSAGTEVMSITSAGNVGIGTTNPTYPLSVHGTVEAEEVIVQTGWSDYVFDKSYRLTPLREVERSIKSQKHLPGMPAAKEVAEHGVKMGEMQAKLLAQIEELTLRQIEQEKEIEALRAEVGKSKP